MLLPLLATKLYLPQTQANLVARPRLLTRLHAALHCPLTLISAPAGFGKTTLISDFRFWILDSPPGGATHPKSKIENPKFAWLSLDEGDNDPVRFWSYIAAALEKVCPGVGAPVQAVLQAPRPPPNEAVLTPLLNTLAEQTETILLALDDYHLIQTQTIHEAITFLVDHLPPTLRLILLTRSDPPLPLARWRVQRRLLEARAADLRFTQEEAAIFLEQTMGLSLTLEQVAQLEARTEGWVAGLQLAALSMQGERDVNGFLNSFTGSNRYILDYLIDEVLQRQPEPLQTFLLQTAILERLTPALCDAVTGRRDSHALLTQLERSNLFLMPLDARREWWRYHHLFVEVLRSRLRQEQSAVMQGLHQRAAAWYVQQALPTEAIHHALVAGDLEVVCTLIEQHGEMMLMRGENISLLNWLNQIPLATRQASPRLSLLWSHLMFHRHQLADAETALKNAMQTIAHQDGSFPGQGEIESEFFGEISALQALIAMNRNDFAHAIGLAQQALLALPQDKVYIRGLVTIWLGMVYCWKGDLAEAYQALARTIELSLRAGDLYTAVVATSVQASVLEEWGDLRQAAKLAQGAIDLAQSHNVLQMPIIGAAYNRLAEYLYEWNQLTEAHSYLVKAIERLEHARNPRVLLLAHVQMAKTLWAQGERRAAHEHLQQGDQVARTHNLSLWYVAIMHACEVDFWLAEGNLVAAAAWVQQRGLTIDDDEAKLTAEERVLYQTFVRILIAQGNLTAALHLLARLIPPAETNRLMRRVIELSALAALVWRAQGEMEQAFSTLRRALTLAEPEGYLRTFVDMGAAMQCLLGEFHQALQTEAAAFDPILLPAYVNKLLVAFGNSPNTPVDAKTDTIIEPQIQNPKLVVEPPKTQNLIEPLSHRELEVLRLVAAGASNQTVADTLYISPGTVKRHVSNIMGKLGAANRTGAVVRAQELGLL